MVAFSNGFRARIVQELVLQVGQSPEILETFQSHAIIAFLVLLLGDSWRLLGFCFWNMQEVVVHVGLILCNYFMDISRHVCVFKKTCMDFTHIWIIINELHQDCQRNVSCCTSCNQQFCRLFPALMVYAADVVMRQLCNLLVSDLRPPNEFLQLAYSSLGDAENQNLIPTRKRWIDTIEDCTCMILYMTRAQDSCPRVAGISNCLSVRIFTVSPRKQGIFMILGEWQRAQPTSLYVAMVI